MTIALVSGSERVDGNTDQVMNHAMRILERLDIPTDLITLRDYRISPCGAGCGNCNWRTNPCAVQDDMPAIIARLRAADGILYAAPVHAFGLAHLMQIFLERAGVGYLRFDRPLANKVGGVVVIGRRYGHLQVHTQLISNILLNRMILVGSGYPVLLDGGQPGEAMCDTEGLDALAYLLERMAAMIFLLRESPRSKRLLRPSSLTERLRPVTQLTLETSIRADLAAGSTIYPRQARR